MKRCITYSNRLQLKRPPASKGRVRQDKKPARAATNPKQSTTPAYRYEVVKRVRAATGTINSCLKSGLSFLGLDPALSSRRSDASEVKEYDVAAGTSR